MDKQLVHADGGDCHGTPLVNGTCPKCGIHPDMQSTELWPSRFNGEDVGETMEFPVKKVAQITGTTPPSGKGDTYARWNGGTVEQLEQLVKEGIADPEDAQNSSPTIGQFIEALKPYNDKVSLIGYVIYPPRSDARVSVEGFVIKNATADEVLELTKSVGHADEYDCDKNAQGLYDARFWWD